MGIANPEAKPPPAVGHGADGNLKLLGKSGIGHSAHERVFFGGPHMKFGVALRNGELVAAGLDGEEGAASTES